MAMQSHVLTQLRSMCLAGTGVKPQSQQNPQTVPWSAAKNASGKRQRLQDKQPTLCQASADSSTKAKISVATLNGTQAAQNGNPVATPNAHSSSKDDADVLIELKDVYKSFGSKHVLQGVSFKIRKGEAVGIIGGSGTGKSTTLRLIAGLVAPDKGEVIIQGHARQGLVTDQVVTDESLKVGLVFQSGALFDSLTVGENVGFLLYEHTKMPKERIKELVADCLAKVGLSGVEDLYPAELSGGMKKRVALARAIIQDDDHLGAEQVIMYDEPTAGLDPVASTIVEDLIRSVHSNGRRPSTPRASNGASAGSKGTSAAPSAAAAELSEAGIAPLIATTTGLNVTAYVVVTHQHSTIRRAVDRLIFLHEGKVVWEGSVEEFDSCEEAIVRQFASGSLKGPLSYA